MMDIKAIAKEFVTSFYQLPHSLAETAWDTVSQNYESMRPGGRSAVGPRLGAPLGIAGPEDSDAVRAVIIFVGADRIIESGFSSAEVVAVFQKLCRHFEESERTTQEILAFVRQCAAADGIRRSVSSPSGEPKYKVFLSHPSGVRSIEAEATEDELQERYLHQKLTVDIFVYGRTVFGRPARHATEQTDRAVDLDENVFRLLVLFLKYKDLRLPVAALYGRAWGIPAERRFGSLDAGMMNNLKRGVSDLRRAFEDVENFRIPPAYGRGRYKTVFYMLRGQFQFCLMLAIYFTQVTPRCSVRARDAVWPSAWFGRQVATAGAWPAHLEQLRWSEASRCHRKAPRVRQRCGAVRGLRPRGQGNDWDHNMLGLHESSK